MNWPSNPFANPFLVQGLSQSQVQQYPPSEFERFQRIRLKHINEMLEQCEKRPEEVVAVATVLLTAEKKAIEEFLGEK